MTTLKKALREFRDCERGTASLEFVLVFPIFFAFFLMTYESGMISLRHVMLERGVDIAVREVRIEVLENPTALELRQRICDEARIIPNCVDQLVLQMDRFDPRASDQVIPDVTCINRGVVGRPTTTYNNGTNNEVLYLVACVRIDPVMPTTGIGQAFVEGGTDASGGSYALVSRAAYVVEPPELVDDGTGGDSGGGGAVGGGEIGDGYGDDTGGDGT